MAKYAHAASQVFPYQCGLNTLSCVIEGQVHYRQSINAAKAENNKAVLLVLPTDTQKYSIVIKKNAVVHDTEIMQFEMD